MTALEAFVIPKREHHIQRANHYHELCGKALADGDFDEAIRTIERERKHIEIANGVGKRSGAPKSKRERVPRKNPINR